MKEIFGNTLGLKSSEQQRLRNTFRRRVDPREIVSAELARHLTELSHELNRQVGVLINRKGDIEHVVVGNAHKLELPDIGRARAGQIRLRGLRLVHTHLKSEPLTKDDLTDLALLRLDCVAAVGVGQEGLPGVLHYAYLVPENGSGEFWQVSKLPSVHVEQPDVLATLDALEEEFNRKAAARTVSGRERAILVAVCLDGNRAKAESSLAELKELARTAGVEVMDSVLQVRREADPRYLIGRGKLDDLNLRSMQSMVDLLIFDKDLTPSQGRHIGDATSLKVLDRTQLILDIFAQRAQTAEGKLQVELAQQKYRLPRLVQGDDSLSRLMGAQRNRREVPVISIVGYTNAGKSTLLNAITNAEVLAEDKLFATLDPTSRRLRFPREREVIITDTVGFIRDLPKDLVAAFRATLEELYDATLLLHVVDAGDPARDDQVEAVETILDSLGLMEKPRLMVWNKADLLPPEEVEQLLRSRGGVAISAAKREGLATLLSKADTTLFAEGASESMGVV
ncbi:MAG: GTPase HflX [Myxococcaceae bacterium]|nr:MAG: GTPase HflX [Myxococcaceae bacterium]